MLANVAIASIAVFRGNRIAIRITKVALALRTADLLYVACLATFVLGGPGPFALDGLLADV